jgi:hypothetical protein
LVKGEIKRPADTKSQEWFDANLPIVAKRVPMPDVTSGNEQAWWVRYPDYERFPNGSIYLFLCVLEDERRRTFIQSDEDACAVLWERHVLPDSPTRALLFLNAFAELRGLTPLYDIPQQHVWTGQAGQIWEPYVGRPSDWGLSYYQNGTAHVVQCVFSEDIRLFGSVSETPRSRIQHMFVYDPPALLISTSTTWIAGMNWRPQFR